MSRDEQAFEAVEPTGPNGPSEPNRPNSPSQPSGPAGTTHEVPQSAPEEAPEETPQAAPQAGLLGPLKDAQTLRPGSAVAVGIAAGVAGVALLGPVVLSADRSWGLVSGGVFALVLVWLFVVRPAAVLHAEGVRLINPMRVVDLTWPAIDEVRSRWVLELVSDGHKYTAWGLPADSSRPKHGREVLAFGTSRLLGRAEEQAAPKPPKLDAKLVAAEVEARIAEERLRSDGSIPRVAVQVWDPVSVGLLLVSAAFFVIATFVA